MLGRSWQNITAGSYPTRSNSAPSNVLSATGTNNANFNFSDAANILTPVGASAGTKKRPLVGKLNAPPYMGGVPHSLCHKSLSSKV